MTTMTTATAEPIPKMLPYRKGCEIDYESLDFNPDEPHLPEDAIFQDNQVSEFLSLFHMLFTDFYARKDTLVTSGAIICWDPANLNAHISPDVCLAFGVDEDAIINRRIYLPWEVGKPPDLVVEVASPSTARNDIGDKVSTYQKIGVPEYWLFDPSGGELYKAPLAGYVMENGVYRPVELTREPDGILKGYSEILRLSLCWDEGMPRLYSPSTGKYIQNWKEERESWDMERTDLEAERLALETENAHLREMVRRMQAGE